MTSAWKSARSYFKGFRLGTGATGEIYGGTVDWFTKGKLSLSLSLCLSLSLSLCLSLSLSAARSSPLSSLFSLSLWAPEERKTSLQLDGLIKETTTCVFKVTLGLKNGDVLTHFFFPTTLCRTDHPWSLPILWLPASVCRVKSQVCWNDCCGAHHVAPPHPPPPPPPPLPPLSLIHL